MKKLLVPCDFSLPAINAFHSAVALAAREESEIHLLHVIELPVLHDAVLMPVISYEEPIFQDLQEKTELEFAKLVDSIPAGKAHVKTRVTFGDTARMIHDYITEQKIDLVVMGTRGASGLREVLIGSNTEKIVRQSTAPVLVIRDVLAVAQITDIVFPNTLETTNQEDLVSRVKALQQFFQAQLHIVWINTPTNFNSDTKNLQRLNEFAHRFMLSNYTVSIWNDVYEETGIVNFARYKKAGLIAMGTHGRKGLAHVFAGSLAEDIVNHLDLPIWTYTLKEKA